MTKLLIIIAGFAAFATGLANAHSEPPLLIDQPPASLDANS